LILRWSLIGTEGSRSAVGLGMVMRLNWWAGITGLIPALLQLAPYLFFRAKC